MKLFHTRISSSNVYKVSTNIILRCKLLFTLPSAPCYICKMNVIVMVVTNIWKMNANIPSLLENICKTNTNIPGLSSFYKLAIHCKMNSNVKLAIIYKIIATIPTLSSFYTQTNIRKMNANSKLETICKIVNILQQTLHLSTILLLCICKTTANIAKRCELLYNLHSITIIQRSTRGSRIYEGKYHWTSRLIDSIEWEIVSSFIFNQK